MTDLAVVETNSRPASAVLVAQMFRTARIIQDAYTNASQNIYPPVVAGPATLDLAGNSVVRRDYLDFTNEVLAALPLGDGFPDPAGRFIWTIHNYQDMINDHGPGSTAPDAGSVASRQTNRAQVVGARIQQSSYQWAGLPGQKLVWITEGGVRLDDVASAYGITDRTQQEYKQAELLARAHNRLVAAEGFNVGLWTNYLNFSHPGFDSGLRNNADPIQGTGGEQRWAYVYWKAFNDRL